MEVAPPSATEVLVHAFDKWVASTEPPADAASRVLRCLTKSLGQQASCAQQPFLSIPVQRERFKYGRKQKACAISSPQTEPFLF